MGKRGGRAAAKDEAEPAEPPAKRSGGRGRGRGRTSAPSDKFVEEREVSRADASLFTTSLRYTVSEACKAGPDAKAMAAEALMKYGQMDGPDKKEFIKQWQKNKKGPHMGQLCPGCQDNRRRDAEVQAPRGHDDVRDPGPQQNAARPAGC